MKTKTFMSLGVKTATPETLLRKAAQLMKENQVGCLPVVRDGFIKGIVTDRDIVVRAVADGIDIDSCTVEDIMTRNPECLTEDHDLSDVVHLMETRKIRRIPIVDEDHLLKGMITLGDLAGRAHDIFDCGEVLERICAPQLIA